MKISSVNATFQPSKIGTAHGLQITYLKDNSTRNIFVYHEDGKVRLQGRKFSLQTSYGNIKTSEKCFTHTNAPQTTFRSRCSSSCARVSVYI